MKRIAFVGGALEALRDFPPDARREAGYQLERVQRGLAPDDWKPMPTIGAGVRELRVRDQRGAFRVIYVATIGDRIHVLQYYTPFKRRPNKPRSATSIWPRLGCGKSSRDRQDD